jgi:hypothetical protein
MQPKELVIPPAAKTDPNSFELLRVWVANADQHVTLATRVWSDPAAWGMMLVDLASHIARAYEQTGGPKYADGLARIKAGFDAEWNAPTDNPSGGLQSRP